MTDSNPKSSSDRENRGRAYVLDEIEPSPGPVDGGELMEDLVAALRRFVALPHTAAHACALWILFAHTFDAHEVSPRLFVTSPEKRCGKTTLLKVIQRLVPRTGCAVQRIAGRNVPARRCSLSDTDLRRGRRLREEQ